MDDTGTYRKDLKSENYDRIFKMYSEKLDDKEFQYYNILRKIDISNIDSEYLDFYNVKSKMPMTTLSFNIYGDIKLWWILYLVNKEIFNGPPLWVEGGNTIKYIKKSYLNLLYQDINKNTVLGGRHY
jgi:hypothetical protein